MSNFWDVIPEILDQYDLQLSFLPDPDNSNINR